MIRCPTGTYAYLNVTLLHCQVKAAKSTSVNGIYVHPLFVKKTDYLRDHGHQKTAWHAMQNIGL